jgi:hypothetical protein
MNIPGFNMNSINIYFENYEKNHKINYWNLESKKNINYLGERIVEKVDSDMSAKQAIWRHVSYQNATIDAIESQRLMDVAYFGFDGKIHQWQIVVNKRMEDDVYRFFEKAFELEFPIDKVIPVSKFNWDDRNSMANNNSSGFNYRYIAGTERLSKHASWFALDINPQQNPDATTQSELTQDPNVDGTLSKKNKKWAELVKFAKNELGWTRGGDWNNKDYQHFEK